MRENLHRFFRAARGAGVHVSPAESIDAMRAVSQVGFSDRAILRDALLLTLAKSQDEKLALGDCFDLFFSQPEPRQDQPEADNDDAPRLLLFSARNRKALDGAVARLSARLKEDASLSLADTAFTLATGRKTFEHRRVVAVRGRGDAIEVLGDAETRRAFTHTALDAPTGAVFLFPGGGAQHTGMAARLYAEDTAFRATVEEGLAALAPEAAREIRAAWLEAPAGDTKAAETLLKPSVQLPAILIIEIAVDRTSVV